MSLFGFSINNLTLFGLVLAVGIVVDDAIVVVENVERKIEHGFSPKDAAFSTMNEVGVALISIALVLCAVFIPTAFLQGIVGQFYRQFALTIAVATVLSAFNSLTLSPALCAIVLQSARGEGAQAAHRPFVSHELVLRGLQRHFRCAGAGLRGAGAPGDPRDAADAHDLRRADRARELYVRDRPARVRPAAGSGLSDPFLQPALGLLPCPGPARSSARPRISCSRRPASRIPLPSRASRAPRAPMRRTPAPYSRRRRRSRSASSRGSPPGSS